MKDSLGWGGRGGGNACIQTYGVSLAWTLQWKKTVPNGKERLAGDVKMWSLWNSMLIFIFTRDHTNVKFEMFVDKRFFPFFSCTGRLNSSVGKVTGNLSKIFRLFYLCQWVEVFSLPSEPHILDKLRVSCMLEESGCNGRNR